MNWQRELYLLYKFGYIKFLEPIFGPLPPAEVIDITPYLQSSTRSVNKDMMKATVYPFAKGHNGRH